MFFVRSVSAAVVLLAVGVTYGVWTDRFGEHPAVGDAARKLEQVPLTAGDWTGRDVGRDDAAFVFKTTAPMILRRYENRLTGDTVGFLLTCGRPKGMIIEHTPRKCYEQSGCEEVGDGRRVAVKTPGGVEAELYSHLFVNKRSPVAAPIRLFWSWGDGTSWSFPERPRVTFAGDAVIYKLYLTRGLVGDDVAPDRDPALDLMRSLIPELNRVLASGGNG